MKFLAPNSVHRDELRTSHSARSRSPKTKSTLVRRSIALLFISRPLSHSRIYERNKELWSIDKNVWLTFFTLKFSKTIGTTESKWKRKHRVVDECRRRSSPGKCSKVDFWFSEVRVRHKIEIENLCRFVRTEREIRENKKKRNVVARHLTSRFSGTNRENLFSTIFLVDEKFSRRKNLKKLTKFVFRLTFRCEKFVEVWIRSEKFSLWPFWLMISCRQNSRLFHKVWILSISVRFLFLFFARFWH